jgi:hypothetical protein
MSKYIDILRYGKKDAANLKSKLKLLGIYIELLSDYVVDVCGNDSTNNCLTEDDAQLLCDKIQILTNLCFQPMGYDYIGTPKQGGIGKMQIGCSFVVS